MPPTINKQLLFANRRFIKSKEARDFDAAVQIYKSNNIKEAVACYRKYFALVELGRLVICADTDFIFPYDKVFTKQNQPKIIDANNRIKSCLDGVANLIGIDDKYFFEGNYRKLSCKNLTEPYINIHLSLKEIATYEIEPIKVPPLPVQL
jgi:hypothetical protein